MIIDLPPTFEELIKFVPKHIVQQTIVDIMYNLSKAGSWKRYVKSLSKARRQPFQSVNVKVPITLHSTHTPTQAFRILHDSALNENVKFKNTMNQNIKQYVYNYIVHSIRHHIMHIIGSSSCMRNECRGDQSDEAFIVVGTMLHTSNVDATAMRPIHLGTLLNNAVHHMNAMNIAMGDYLPKFVMNNAKDVDNEFNRFHDYIDKWFDIHLYFNSFSFVCTDQCDLVRRNFIIKTIRGKNHAVPNGANIPIDQAKYACWRMIKIHPEFGGYFLKQTGSRLSIQNVVSTVRKHISKDKLSKLIDLVNQQTQTLTNNPTSFAKYMNLISRITLLSKDAYHSVGGYVHILYNLYYLRKDNVPDTSSIAPLINPKLYLLSAIDNLGFLFEYVFAKTTDDVSDLKRPVTKYTMRIIHALKLGMKLKIPSLEDVREEYLTYMKYNGQKRPEFSLKDRLNCRLIYKCFEHMSDEAMPELQVTSTRKAFTSKTVSAYQDFAVLVGAFVIATLRHNNVLF
jgi:hypothetical protein